MKKKVLILGKGMQKNLGVKGHDAGTLSQTVQLKKKKETIHSSIIHNSQNTETTQCPSTDKWKDKMWYIYTVE